jgi:hypothetical protein
MSEENKIERGDFVRVILIYHQNANPEGFEGVVLYIPQATGDCWHIRERIYKTGNQHPTDLALRYVQTFAEIVLLKKGENTP